MDLSQADLIRNYVLMGLSNDEQNTVSQIRSYIVQARSALKDQDLERAHNLALKAHQLADVLLRQ